MRNDDLIRRLQKLVALKEHPSTLPAIRDEAARAEQSLREQMRQTGEPPPGTYQRLRWGLVVDTGNLGCRPDGLAEFLRDINKETPLIWAKIKPARPGE